MSTPMNEDAATIPAPDAAPEPPRARLARGTDPVPTVTSDAEPTDAFSLAYVRYLAAAHGERT